MVYDLWQMFDVETFGPAQETSHGGLIGHGV